METQELNQEVQVLTSIKNRDFLSDNFSFRIVDVTLEYGEPLKNAFKGDFSKYFISPRGIRQASLKGWLMNYPKIKPFSLALLTA